MERGPRVKAQHAPKNARNPGVCCLRVSPDKPNHDGFATHKAVSTKRHPIPLKSLRFCRGMICSLLPFLVLKGKSPRRTSGGGSDNFTMCGSEACS